MNVLVLPAAAGCCLLLVAVRPLWLWLWCDSVLFDVG
jgi:hypothetical protein